jgi:hypothetical protein
MWPRALPGERKCVGFRSREGGCDNIDDFHILIAAAFAAANCADVRVPRAEPGAMIAERAFARSMASYFDEIFVD